MTSPHPAEEPRSDIRQYARAVREIYVALLQEGFTEQQSLIIVAQIITSNIAKS